MECPTQKRCYISIGRCLLVQLLVHFCKCTKDISLEKGESEKVISLYWRRQRRKRKGKKEEGWGGNGGGRGRGGVGGEGGKKIFCCAKLNRISFSCPYSKSKMYWYLCKIFLQMFTYFYFISSYLNTTWLNVQAVPFLQIYTTHIQTSILIEQLAWPCKGVTKKDYLK